MIKHTFLLCFIAALTVSGCTEQQENEFEDCRQRAIKFEGTYYVTLTEYPLQETQEGGVFEVLVFPRLDRCYDHPDPDAIDRILFNGLLDSHGGGDCISAPLIDDTSFEITYDDGYIWAGAPVRGHGYIIDGILHFEGFVFNSTQGEMTIVLDGFKETQEMRTSAC